MTLTHRASLVLASVFAVAFAAEARAQGTIPTPPGIPPYMNRPAVSPYLNLLRGGTNPAINYYGLVRPEFQFRRSINALSRDIQETQTDINTGQAGAALQTGHPVQFMNLSHFYGGGQGSTLGRSGTGRQTTTPTFQSGASTAGAKPAKTR
jgi:hypothetical protein